MGTESDIYVFLVIIRYDLVVCIPTFPNLALFRVLSKTRGRHLSTFDDYFFFFLSISFVLHFVLHCIMFYLYLFIHSNLFMFIYMKILQA